MATVQMLDIPALQQPLDDASVQARIRQEIPTVDSKTAALVALFEAALVAKPYGVTLSETDTPGVGAALISWARAKGLLVEEHHYVTERGNYANVEVRIVPGRVAYTISVLGYRTLAESEAAAIPVRLRERSEERIGTAEFSL